MTKLIYSKNLDRYLTAFRATVCFLIFEAFFWTGFTMLSPFINLAETVLPKELAYALMFISISFCSFLLFLLTLTKLVRDE